MSHDIEFGSILGFRLVTSDPDRLTAFYRAIGFSIGAPAPIAAGELELLGVRGHGARIAMSLGPSRVDLDIFDEPGQRYPGDAAACDLIFQHFALVTDDAGAAWCRARDGGATPISRTCPVVLPRSDGGVIALKFRDPDGHPLEFLQFPVGANPAWTGRGILGIDHSAISVSNVAASRHFYADRGLTEGSATVNHGSAQDALDALDRIQLDVVPMNPASETPHLELLGYRHPVGRALRSLAANDIAATRIVWRSNRDALVCDPDGHRHQLSR